MRQLCVALLHHIDSCRLGKRKKNNYLHGLKKNLQSVHPAVTVTYNSWM